MTEDNTTEKSESGFLTCKQWVEKYPWPPMGGLRHLILNADKNGFHRVIRRPGSRILLIEKEFLQWIEDQK